MTITFRYFPVFSTGDCIRCHTDIPTHGVVPVVDNDEPLCQKCLKAEDPAAYQKFQQFLANIAKVDSWEEVSKLRNRLTGVDTVGLDKAAAGRRDEE